MTDTTTHASMNMIIHAALRRDLARFHDALAGFPAGSRPRADQLAAAWDNFADQLHRHHTSEETIFFPTFRELSVDQPLIDQLDAEHAAMVAALDAATRSIQALHADPSAANAGAARDAVAQLSAVLTAHLDHEERDLEPFAARYATSPQFKRAQARVRKAHDGDAGTFMSWLVDGAESETVAALRKQIPPPVLFVLTRIAGRRCRRRIATAWG
jgi:iron-sulfur cluster repair protein YtfE (RIC family)